jgi:hypothetical protein
MSLQMAANTIHLLFNARRLCQQAMVIFKPFLLLALFGSVLAVPAEAQKGRRGEQDAALQATRQGDVLPLRSIENYIIPSMKARGANYIGAEFDGQAARYRLKFIHDGAVIWVDVDGRSGAVIGRTDK